MCDDENVKIAGFFAFHFSIFTLEVEEFLVGHP